MSPEVPAADILDPFNMSKLLAYGYTTDYDHQKVAFNKKMEHYKKLDNLSISKSDNYVSPFRGSDLKLKRFVFRPLQLIEISFSVHSFYC